MQLGYPFPTDLTFAGIAQRQATNTDIDSRLRCPITQTVKPFRVTSVWRTSNMFYCVLNVEDKGDFVNLRPGDTRKGDGQNSESVEPFRR